MSTNLKAATTATKIYFFVCGLGLSAWAPLVPFAKDRLALNDANLGLLLLFLGIGAFSTMPVTGWLLPRVGTKMMMILTALVIALALPTLAIINTFAGMAVMLFVFGIGVGGIDIAMNTHGSMVQSVSGKHIMSSLHGLFSVGGLCGPLLVSAFLKMGLNLLTSVSVLAVVIFVLIIFSYQNLFTLEDERRSDQDASEENTGSKNKGSAWLNGTVLILGLMCFIAFLSEGAMIDWAALLLRDHRGADENIAGIGYAAFSIAMAVMRLAGDKMITQFSNYTVVLAGSCIAFLGYACIIFIPTLPAALLGFILIGVGASNIVPVFFSKAGSLKMVSAAAAVSVMGTIGYTGQLAGPAVLGFLAQHFSLPLALFITGVMTLVSGCCYWLWQRR